MAENRISQAPLKRGLLERIGTALPESNLLFLMLMGVIVVLSFIAQGEYAGAQEGSTYVVNNLLSAAGLRWILYNVIDNFRNYPPLGIVIVGVIGFGFAEKIGLLGTIIKKVGHTTPERYILPVIIFIGINSSIASDAGYIVLVPLAGALYAGLGKNPLVGICAAFAAVSAGFGAALIPTPSDGLLGSVTQNVVENTLGKEFTYNAVTMNLIFMIVSTLFLTVLLTFVTTKFIEKRALRHEIVVPKEEAIEIGELSDKEKKGLQAAGWALLTVVGIVGLLYFTGVLQSYEQVIDEAGSIKNYNPILDNIIVIMICVFLFPSIAYGKALGVIHSGKEYINVTVSAMKDMAYILVFAIFAGNFLAIFSHSGLDQFIANHGAQLLIKLNIQNVFVLILLFMVLSAFVNLFMGSASAKWTLLAPIFIVMLDSASNGQLSPDVIQAAYRVADSSTNIITPLMSYMGVVLIMAKKYSPKFEIGDLMSIMVPYSLLLFIGWSGLFVLWLLLGLPFGI